MIKGISRRATAGLMAFAIVLAQVISTVPAFADSPTQMGPTISKVDGAGNLLPGGTFEGYSCTRWENDLNWQCDDLSNYEWFSQGLTLTGTTGGGYSDDIPMRDTTVTSCSDSANLTAIVAVRETSAPLGYAASWDWNVICKTTNGWMAGDDIIPSFESLPGHLFEFILTDGSYVSQSVIVDEESGQSTPVSTLNIVNSKKAPVFQKVDEKGALLPGATFEGESCTRWENDLNWQCQSLNEYSWFNQGLADIATTNNSFGDEIPMRGTEATSCSDDRLSHIVRIREVTAPAGYDAINGWNVICQTVDGWVADGGAVAPNGEETASLQPGVTINVENNIITFVNKKSPTPVMPELTINKVDQDGKLLPGATFAGMSCTKFDDEPDWTCVSLNDYYWFREGLTEIATTAQKFTNEIDMEGTLATSCSDPRMSHFVAFRELSAPNGYDYVPGWNVVCQTVHGWIADGEAIPGGGITLEGGTAILTGSANSNVTTDGKNVNIKNYEAGKGGETPTEPTTPVVPAPTKPTPSSAIPAELPHTGSSEGQDVRGLLMALIASAIAYGAVYFAQPRRSYEDN